MSAAAFQLTFDGREVPVEGFSTNGRRLGRQQSAVLRELAQTGSMRSIQAGVVIHRDRGCGFGARSHSGYSGDGCCEYASTDGSQVLKSLARRGIVVQIGGVWYLPAHDET